MNFTIELRHAPTGRAYNFPDRQAVIAFLEEQDYPEDFEGWQNLNIQLHAPAEAAPASGAEAPAPAVRTRSTPRKAPAVKKTAAKKAAKK